MRPADCLARALPILTLAAACDGGVTPPSLRTLVVGEAHLVGFGARACSRGPSGGGDGPRHCAFFRPSADDPKRTELWVIDASRVLAGEAIACDGRSTGCLRLTDALYTGVKIGSPSHPEAHRFEGDTLFFLAEPSPTAESLDIYEGRVFVWRPGWKQPRAITSDRGVLCRGSDAAPVAYCIDGVSERPRTEFDLRAGRLVDRQDAVLPVVERIAPLRGGSVVWSAAFTPAGASLAFSSWRDGDPAETLRVAALGERDTGEARAVLEEGRGWTLSPDGQAVYFMRGGREGRAGALWSADFPTGAAPAMLADGVFQFETLGQDRDLGVAFLTELRGLEGTLHVLRDRRKPEGRRMLARDAHFWYPSADGRFSYVLQVDADGERGLVGDNERGTTCKLGTREDIVVHNPGFLPRLGALTWTEPDPADEDLSIRFLGRPEDCGGARPIGAGIEAFLPLGGRGLVFATARGDEPPTFFHLPVWDGRPLDGLGQPILTHVDDAEIAVVGDEPEALVLGTRPTAPQGRGLFLFGPLPTGPAR